MANSSSMPGRSTLTATSRPSVVTARWTCAIEAAPTGTSSNAAEQRLDRRFERLLDRALDRGEGLGGQRILELEEVGRGGLADEVGTGRQRLAELDRGGADRLQRGGIIGDRRAGAAPKRATRTGGARWRGVSGSRSIPPQRAVPRQRPPPFEEAPEMRRRRWSNLPAAVDRDEPAEDRLDAGRLEAGVGDHRAERVHAREAADRFDEVAVAVLVARDGLADARDDVRPNSGRRAGRSRAIRWSRIRGSRSARRA